MSAAPIPVDVAPTRPGSPAALFWAFNGLALKGFGGVLAIAQHELVERRRWLTREQFLEEWAVAQVLPGPNVVNLALTLGDGYFGWRGALAALSGMLLFPLLLVLALAAGFVHVADQPIMQGALRGMGAVAAGLIAATGLKLMSALKGNPVGAPVAWACVAITFVAVGILRWPLVLVLVGVGVPSCLWAAWRLRRRSTQA